MSESAAAPSANPAPSAEEGGKLGTFGGVFTPSVLTILGVVMFLRFGFVTGHAGLDGVILIVLLANAVSVLTSLSLAVIATNTRVKGGGDYFLISRSLGLEFGGAIGTVLYVAQSVSVGFYVVGFTEGLVQITGNLALPVEILGWELPGWLLEVSIPSVISTCVCLGLFGLAYKGADLATRFQYVIMAALGLALVAFFIGAANSFDPAILEDNRAPLLHTVDGQPGLPFWAAFAIFFPAITGFTQGVSMSGDLKDPQKSLPTGTFLAVGVSLAVYLILPFAIAGSTTQEQLVTDAGAATMKNVALVPWLVDAGVFAATLSSGLASMMGAPRILRAMGLDELFPGASWFARGELGSEEPRRAMWLTLAIALVCIWAGDLNAIAGVVTMFFLLSYGALNYATFIEGFSRNPNFRPRFRFSGWRTSLVGAFTCGAVMLAIDPLATIVSLIVIYGIYRYLVRRDLDQPGGDARRGFYVQRIKDYLLKLGERPSHPRNWRPVVIAVAHRGEAGEPLARFASSIGSNQGILTLATVLVGPFEEMLEDRRQQLRNMNRFVQAHNPDFFYEVTIADSHREGIRQLLLVHGIGQLRPNTLLLSWSSDLESEYVDVLGIAAALDYNVVLLSAATEGPFPVYAADTVKPHERRIDVWWRGHRNGSLALLLAHLVRETRDWRGCEVRLLRIVAEESEQAPAAQELESLLERSRIEADVRVVAGDTEPFDVIAAESGGSHLVFMGVGEVGEGSRADLSRYNEVLDRLPTTALVCATRALDVEA